MPDDVDDPAVLKAEGVHAPPAPRQGVAPQRCRRISPSRDRRLLVSHAAGRRRAQWSVSQRVAPDLTGCAGRSHRTHGFRGDAREDHVAVLPHPQTSAGLAKATVLEGEPDQFVATSSAARRATSPVSGTTTYCTPSVVNAGGPSNGGRSLHHGAAPAHGAPRRFLGTLDDEVLRRRNPGRCDAVGGTPAVVDGPSPAASDREAST